MTACSPGPRPPGSSCRRADSIAVELRKPGYVTVRHALEVPAHDTALPPFTLVAITGFEGVWALPGGELRAFRRTDDRVEVSKLASVDGEREFFRHYRLVASAAGVEFVSTESTNIEPAAPNEPSCHVPHDTAYHYEPATDALSVRQQRVRHKLIDGTCIITSSGFLEAMPLVRADRPSTHERETIAPVGIPRPPPTKPPPPTKGKPAPPTKGKQAPVEPVQLQKQSKLGTLPEVRKDRPPAAPNALDVEPRGDSQIAPPVDSPPVQQRKD